MTVPSRPVWPAMKRGFFGRCPHCGDGRIFGKFLKVQPECTACGTAFHHHRADDMPPYIVMFLVGHIVVGGLVMAETEANWPTWVHVALWPTLGLVLGLALLQPVKGAIIALQWALRMHGFSSAPEQPALDLSVRS
ncbi:MAG: DUF983 domain-containing protein [Beijerinckiaceae bacterium]